METQCGSLTAFQSCPDVPNFGLVRFVIRLVSVIGLSAGSLTVLPVRFLPCPGLTWTALRTLAQILHHLVRSLGGLISLNRSRESRSEHHGLAYATNSLYFDQAFKNFDPGPPLLIHFNRKPSSSNRDDGRGRAHSK